MAIRRREALRPSALHVWTLHFALSLNVQRRIARERVPTTGSRRSIFKHNPYHSRCLTIETLQDGCGSGAGEFLADGPGEAGEPGDGVGDGVSVGEAAPGEEALSRGEGDGLARMSSHAQSSPVYPP